MAKFRFTIRDLLWITAVVALGAGWWLDHTNANRKLSKLEEAQQRILFYMDIVERLQSENYRLKREGKREIPVTTHPDDGLSREQLDQLFPRFPTMPRSP